MIYIDRTCIGGLIKPKFVLFINTINGNTTYQEIAYRIRNHPSLQNHFNYSPNQNVLGLTKQISNQHFQEKFIQFTTTDYLCQIL